MWFEANHAYAQTTALRYQGELYLCRAHNVRQWPIGTKMNHVCAMDQTLDIGFEGPRKNHNYAAYHMIKGGFVAKAKSFVPRGPN